MFHGTAVPMTSSAMTEEIKSSKYPLFGLSLSIFIEKSIVYIEFFGCRNPPFIVQKSVKASAANSYCASQIVWWQDILLSLCKLSKKSVCIHFSDALKMEITLTVYHFLTSNHLHSYNIVSTITFQISSANIWIFFYE